MRKYRTRRKKKQKLSIYLFGFGLKGMLSEEAIERKINE